MYRLVYLIVMFGFACDRAQESPSRDALPVDTGVSDARGDALLSDASPDVRWAMPTRGQCESGYGPSETGATPRDAKLVETSGLVASPSWDGLMWAHNDSGDEAWVYGIGLDGTARARLELPVDATDWELKAGLRRARHRLLRLQLGSITLDLRRHI